MIWAESSQQKKGKWLITFKKCPILWAIREIPSKTTSRFPLTQAGGLPSRNNNSKCWQGWRDMGTFIHPWWEWKLEGLLRKSAQLVLKIPATELLGTICTLLSILPEDRRSYVLLERHSLIHIHGCPGHRNQEWISLAAISWWVENKYVWRRRNKILFLCKEKQN